MSDIFIDAKIDKVMHTLAKRRLPNFKFGNDTHWLEIQTDSIMYCLLCDKRLGYLFNKNINNINRKHAIYHLKENGLLIYV